MVKVGIIGMGRIGKVHLRSIFSNVAGAEVVSVADPFINEETKQFLNGFGIRNVFTDYRDILSDKEINAVLICSSTDTHSQISIEAARAGKNIFCEKPIDHDLDRIWSVLEEVKKSGVKFQVGFNRRFDHNFKAVRDAVVSGKIGDPHIIKITSRDPDAPPVSYVKVSGGIFLDMTIHDFDMIRYLSGSEADEVYAAGTVLVDQAIGEAGDIDTAIVTVKMKNGCLAVIDNSRKAVYGYDQRAEVFGSKGAVITSNDTNSTAVLSTVDGVTAEKPLYFFLERYMQSFADEMKSFIDSIISDNETAVCAYDGLASVIIGLAAKKSLQENRPVKLTEIYGGQ